MNDQPRFNWELTDTVNTNLDTATGVLRIKPAKLFEHISQLQVRGEPSFSYLLVSEFAPKKKAEFIEQFEPPKPKTDTFITQRTIEQPKSELDLHIEALVDNRKGLSNADIVHVQLETLRHYLQLAIVHRQERMIIIHGLGKGKLREEVHKILKQMPEISRFKNEWSGRYGFGATEVWFRHH
jgi:dsDNA-specific endonuclease/ATPase MutS2